MNGYNFRSSLRIGLAAVLMLGAIAPVLAQSDESPGRPGQANEAPPPKKKHHNSGIGAAIGAGVLGGVVGGALLGGQGQAAPGYQPPPPVYEAPPPRAYDAEADGYDEPVCRMVRKPVYDEDGVVVDYRTRRVCR